MKMSDALELMNHHEVIHVSSKGKTMSFQREGDVLIISTNKPIRVGIPFRLNEPVFFVHNHEVIKIPINTHGYYYKGRGFIRVGKKWVALGKRYLKGKTNKILSFNIA